MQIRNRAELMPNSASLLVGPKVALSLLLCRRFPPLVERFSSRELAKCLTST